MNFNRKYRLTHKREFQSVFAQPYKTTHRYLIALYRPNQLSHARLGMIIGKRYVSTAVARNRCRRIIRDSFRHLHEGLAGLDIVILVRSAAPQLNQAAEKQALRSDVDTLWQTLIQKASSHQS